VVLIFEKRRQNAQRLPVDVIDNRGQEQKSADPPPQISNQAAAPVTDGIVPTGA
jgi:hypothetical protein